MVVDVIVVGAGPAGISAALILGRCRRRVIVFDTRTPRNASSRALHGFITRDGTPPMEFLRLARDELAKYETVQIHDAEVTEARCGSDGIYTVVVRSGLQYQAKKLLLATGVCDNLPDIPGFKELYGSSVFHCPYCDGWEVRDRPLAIYGRGARGFGLALELTAWSRDLALCTDGPAGIEPDDLARLRRNRIIVREERVVALEGQDGRLTRVVFAEGPAIDRHALFFSTGQYQRSALLEHLGCEFNEKGTVMTGKYETTHMPGLFVAGDASRKVQWVVVAAAEGAEAAFAINTDLLKEETE
jgi:thioredoxin reductase